MNEVLLSFSLNFDEMRNDLVSDYNERLPRHGGPGGGRGWRGGRKR